MNRPDDTAKPPLQRSRQVTIDALCEHFANDAMAVEEFERRIDTAHRAESSEELKELLRDLPGGTEATAVTSPGSVAASVPAASRGVSYGVTDAAHVRDNQFMVAIMGASTRKGRWTPARTNYAVAVMGGTELDFREAQMPPGVTTVQVFTMWGGVEIIVPPGLRVESHGVGILGGFEHSDDAGGVDPGMDAPVLRITGAAVMGGVEIKCRYAGESAGDARRRRRIERKEQRRLRGG